MNIPLYTCRSDGAQETIAGTTRLDLTKGASNVFVLTRCPKIESRQSTDAIESIKTLSPTHSTSQHISKSLRHEALTESEIEQSILCPSVGPERWRSVQEKKGGSEKDWSWQGFMDSGWIFVPSQ